mgnify:CR=1 FL=1
MATAMQADLMPEVTAFLKSGPLGGVIAGRQTASSNQATFTTVDPGSGDTLAEVYAMQPDDVDIPQTVEKLVQAITFHTGQVCCDATRWLIHKKIYGPFVEACVERPTTGSTPTTSSPWAFPMAG